MEADPEHSGNEHAYSETTSNWWTGTAASRGLGRQIDAEDTTENISVGAKDTSADQTSFVWRSWRAGILLPLVLYVAIIIFTSAFWGAFGRVSTTPDDPFVCLPNGNPFFPWQKRSSSIWNPALFLSITLSFGNFSFAQAKAIDISWDLVIGRGGQTLLSIWVYRIMRRSLFFAMEKQRVHLAVIICLTFEKATWTSLWAALKEGSRRKGSSFKDRQVYLESAAVPKIPPKALFCYIIAVLYVLAFGTVVSAMTGYQAKMKPMTMDPVSHDSIPSSSLATVNQNDVLLVEEGMRANLNPWFSDDTALLVRGANDTFNDFQAYEEIVRRTCMDIPKLTPPDAPHNGTDTIFVGRNLIAIDYLILPDNYTNCTTSRLTINNQTTSLEYPPVILRTDSWIYNASWTFMDQNWLRSNTICQPQKNYEWGFSSLMLFSFCIATILFLGCLLSLQSDLWWNSRSDRIQHSFSINRDILDLADAIREEIGCEAGSLQDNELDEKVDAKTSGVQIDVKELPCARKDQPAKPARYGEDAAYLFVGLHD